jgi:hypothetical protein
MHNNAIAIILNMQGFLAQRKGLSMLGGFLQVGRLRKMSEV